MRDANGNVVVDANGLPKISTTNKTLGKFTPDWTGGISNTFSYRSLSLSFLIDASVGGSIFSNTNKTGKYTGVLANTLSGRDAEHGGLWYYTAAMGNNVRLPESPSYSVSSDGLYYAQVNGQSTRVYQDGIMVEGVTESGSKMCIRDRVSIVPDAGTNKTNISLNTDYHLAKWIVVGATANYIVYTCLLYTSLFKILHIMYIFVQNYQCVVWQMERNHIEIV